MRMGNYLELIADGVHYEDSDDRDSVYLGLHWVVITTLCVRSTCAFGKEPTFFYTLSINSIYYPVTFPLPSRIVLY